MSCGRKFKDTLSSRKIYVVAKAFCTSVNLGILSLMSGVMSSAKVYDVSRD
jgi:hypothetical protein